MREFAEGGGDAGLGGVLSCIGSDRAASREMGGRISEKRPCRAGIGACRRLARFTTHEVYL